MCLLGLAAPSRRRASSARFSETHTVMLVEQSTLRGHKGSVLAIRFSRDGKYCMSGGDDRRVLLWNPRREDPTPIKEYTGHSHRVLDVAVGHDNTTFTSCGDDRAVFTWDVASGRVTRRLQGHTQRVNAVASAHSTSNW